MRGEGERERSNANGQGRFLAGCTPRAAAAAVGGAGSDRAGNDDRSMDGWIDRWMYRRREGAAGIFGALSCGGGGGFGGFGGDTCVGRRGGEGACSRIFVMHLCCALPPRLALEEANIDTCQSKEGMGGGRHLRPPASPPHSISGENKQKPRENRSMT